MTKESTIARLTELRPSGLNLGEREAMLGRIMDSPRSIADDPWLAYRQRRSTRTALLASAAAVAIVAGVGGTVITVSSSDTSGPSAHEAALRIATPGHPAGSTIRARLLSALDGATGDIVETRTVISDGQIIDEWANGNNTRSVTVDSGYSMEPLEENLTTYDPAGATSLTLWPETKTWTIDRPNPSSPNPNHPIAPPSLRQQVQDGVLRVVGSGISIDGHDTIELTATDTGPGGVSSHIWVDSTTYLPVRQTLAQNEGVTGPSSQTDWTYYAPTPQALDKLQLTVPAGFTQASGPPTTIAPSTSGSGS